MTDALRLRRCLSEKGALFRSGRLRTNLVREAPWSAVAAATAFVPTSHICGMNRKREAVAAATALRGAFGAAILITIRGEVP
jgi:hypothetical protein